MWKEREELGEWFAFENDQFTPGQCVENKDNLLRIKNPSFSQPIILCMRHFDHFDPDNKKNWYYSDWPATFQEDGTLAHAFTVLPNYAEFPVAWRMPLEVPFKPNHYEKRQVCS